MGPKIRARSFLRNEVVSLRRIPNGAVDCAGDRYVRRGFRMPCVRFVVHGPRLSIVGGNRNVGTVGPFSFGRTFHSGRSAPFDGCFSEAFFRNRLGLRR